MAGNVKPIPEGYHTATPYLIVKGAAGALEFYKKAFGAKELVRLAHPDGRIGHAEMKIGDSIIMLADEGTESGYRSPQSLGGSAVGLMLYVEDVDAVFNQAIGAGAKVNRPVQDQFYGDRIGGLTDPFGHVWWIATHKEDVTPEELKRRVAAAHSAAAGAAGRKEG
ncbi:MAG: VOC family protein [Terriglobia bacterium]